MSTATPDAIVAAARAVPSGLAFLASRGRHRKPRHVHELDRALCDLEARRIRMLIVEMPPRHGKSETGTKTFPAWYLGRHPDQRVAALGYGADLAIEYGRANRELLEMLGPSLFGVTVDPRNSAADAWGILGRKGGMFTAGVGGALTGKGANLLVIDDPIKNHEEAQSAAHREKIWNWYTSTARTRLEPDGVQLIIQTRWHEDDLAGRLQRNLPANARVIRMPAIAEADDPLGRAVGEALWPERYPVAVLEDIRNTVGSYVWNALYQQRPVALGGNILKTAWWRYYDDPPQSIAKRCDDLVMSVDCSFKDSDGADRVSIQVWGRIGADFYLLDNHTAVLDFPGTRTAMRVMCDKWPMVLTKLVEDKANGSALIADLKHEIPGLIPVEPQGGKTARVIAVSPLAEARNVHLPSRAVAPWGDDFVAEAAAFPNGANDDQVDAMSQALIRMKPGAEAVAARNPQGDPEDVTSQAEARAGRRRDRRLADYWGADDTDDGDDEP